MTRFPLLCCTLAFARRKWTSHFAIFESHVNSIKDGVNIFLSFGEIDCRNQEGIIHYFKKNGGNLEDIIRATVSGYFDYVTGTLKEKKSNVFFFSVPAPVINETHNTKLKEVNLLRIDVIKLFNQQLQWKISGTEFKYIDTYSKTDDGTGRSNKKFHVDDAHLDYRILPFIEKQLMRQAS